MTKLSVLLLAACALAATACDDSKKDAAKPAQTQAASGAAKAPAAPAKPASTGNGW
jgi:cytochrome c5